MRQIPQLVLMRQKRHPKSDEQAAFMCIREYCLHSFLYYVGDVTLISDEEYDNFCKWLVENYEWVKEYDVNDYLDKEALIAGTGYNLKLKGMTLAFCQNVRDGLK